MSLDAEYVIFNIIVDDGAETIALYNYFPKAKIYAFEGDATMAPICAANLAPYADRVTFTAQATTDYDGTMMLHGVEVPCGRLDTFVANNGIDRVDFLLINHKTGVLPALQGLGDQLQYVQYLYSLITYYEVFTGQVINCNDFLLARDFTTMDVLNYNYWQDMAMYRNNRFDLVCCTRGFSDEYMVAAVNKMVANTNSLHFVRLIVPDATFDATKTYLASQLSAETFAKCRFINETAFPFSAQTVETYSPGAAFNEAYFIQLLHLYVWKIIQGLTGRYLVVDAATVFTVPTTHVIKRTNLYNWTTGTNAGVFQQMAALHPFFKRVDPDKSGEVFYAMMEQRHMACIFALVEMQHNVPFYEAYLNCIPSFDTKTASEYELYFNYLQLSGYTNFVFRQLSWRAGTIAEADSATDVDYLVCSQ